MQLKCTFIQTLTLLFNASMVVPATDFNLLNSRSDTNNKKKLDPDPFKTLKSLNEKKWFLENRTSNTPPPLLGFNASCLEMQIFSVEDDSESTLMLLYYKNSDNVRESEILNVTVKKSTGGRPVLEFHFEDPINPSLKGRVVQYLVMKTDYDSCYVLKTSTRRECTYWVLHTQNDEMNRKKCTPPQRPICVNEVYGPHKTTKCSDSNMANVPTREPETSITPSHSTAPSQANNLLSEFRNKNIYLRYKSYTSDLYLLGFPATCIKMEFIQAKKDTKDALLFIDYKDSNKEWHTELGNVTLKNKEKSHSLGSLIFWIEESETVTSNRRARYQILSTDSSTCFTLKLGMSHAGKHPECGVWSVDKINTTSVPQVCMDGYMEGCRNVPLEIMSPDGCY